MNGPTISQVVNTRAKKNSTNQSQVNGGANGGGNGNGPGSSRMAKANTKSMNMRLRSEAPTAMQNHNAPS